MEAAFLLCGLQKYPWLKRRNSKAQRADHDRERLDHRQSGSYLLYCLKISRFFGNFPAGGSMWVIYRKEIPFFGRCKFLIGGG